MISRKKVIVLLVIVAILLAVPATVLANKRLYKANVSWANEVPPAQGTSASGAMVLGFRPDGVIFQLQIRNLSGPVSGTHLHGPASASQNAPILLTLCGNPAPAVAPTCTLDSNNTLVLMGEITPSLLAAWGLTAAQFQAYLDGGLVYVNAHTALNPAGEARGQLIPQ